MEAGTGCHGDDAITVCGEATEPPAVLLPMRGAAATATRGMRCVEMSVA